MSDGIRDDHDDEDRWLEAQERGRRAPPIPASTAARYDQLRSLIAGLPTVPIGARLPTSWRQSVLDAIDRGEGPVPADVAPEVEPIAAEPSKRTRTRRRAVIASGCVALAAGVAILVKVWPGRPELQTTAELSISAVAGEQMLAGSDELRAGGKAVARGVIDGPGELRVYDADDRELTRCTATGPGCSVDRSGRRTELRVELSLPVPGPLHIVLLSAPLPGPSGGRARDLEAADHAGITARSLDKIVR
jgi:hypothetical protein